LVPSIQEWVYVVVQGMTAVIMKNRSCPSRTNHAQAAPCKPSTWFDGLPYHLIYNVYNITSLHKEQLSSVLYVKRSVARLALAFSGLHFCISLAKLLIDQVGWMITHQASRLLQLIGIDRVCGTFCHQ
jgi:hypothetical protein